MANSAFAPVQLTQFKLEDFQSEDGISRFNQQMTNVVKALNSVVAGAGPVTLPAGVDLQGASIANVGGVGPQHEVVSKAYAEANYSAAAIKPKLEAGGSHALTTVRRVNDSRQLENSSAFLEGALNTAPTTNTSTITGSGSTVSISSGQHLLVSGNVQAYASRTDTFSLPSSFTLSSISRSSSIVTAITSTATGYAPGSVINAGAVSDSSFDGSFVLVTAVGTTLTWAQVAPNASATGGTVSEGSVYYYRLGRNQKTLSLIGPYSADSQQSRLQANTDGGVLIGVVVLNGSGVDLTQSAAGATPPPANGGVHIVTRL
jgi:hypothetical protein